MEAFVVGLNGTGGSTTTNFRVGRNELDGFYDDVVLVPPAANVTDAMIYADDSGLAQAWELMKPIYKVATPEGPHSLRSALNSCSPVFTRALTPHAISDSFLSNYITEISAIVEAGGESLTLISPVPEPSSSLLIALGAVILSLRRRVS